MRRRRERRVVMGSTRMSEDRRLTNWEMVMKSNKNPKMVALSARRFSCVRAYPFTKMGPVWVPVWRGGGRGTSPAQVWGFGFPRQGWPARRPRATTRRALRPRRASIDTMAAMATCTQAFAGLSVKASAKAAPAKMTVKAHIGGKSVAGKAFLSRTHRAQRLVVRAEAEEAAEAEASMDDEGDAEESDAPRARGAYPPVDVPSVASRVSGAERAVSMRDATLFPPSAGTPPGCRPGRRARGPDASDHPPLASAPSTPAHRVRTSARSPARRARARPPRDPSPARAWRPSQV